MPLHINRFLMDGLKRNDGNLEMQLHNLIIFADCVRTGSEVGDYDPDPEQRQAVENMLDAMTEGLANAAICRAIREDVRAIYRDRGIEERDERTLQMFYRVDWMVKRFCLPTSTIRTDVDDEGVLEYWIGWSLQHGQRVTEDVKYLLRD